MEHSKIDQEPSLESPRKIIFACFENPDTLSPESQIKIERIKKEGINIDWHAEHNQLEVNNMRHEGEGTYVISPLDDKDKYSEEYETCLGIIAVGKNHEGKNISFMSHQYPYKVFVDDEVEKSFNNDLVVQLQKLQEQSVNGSIDVVFLGGQYSIIPSWYYPDQPVEEDKEAWEVYEKSMNKMRELVFSALHREPTIITGPKARMVDGTSAYFSTRDRRLYIVQDDYTLGQASRVSDIRRLYKR